MVWWFIPIYNAPPPLPPRPIQSYKPQHPVPHNPDLANLRVVAAGPRQTPRGIRPAAFPPPEEVQSRQTPSQALSVHLAPKHVQRHVLHEHHVLPSQLDSVALGHLIHGHPKRHCESCGRLVPHEDFYQRQCGAPFRSDCARLGHGQHANYEVERYGLRLQGGDLFRGGHILQVG